MKTSYNDTANLYYRKTIDSNRVSGPWRVILSDVNYTSYTVTKTGSGASGTWGISISGSSNSSTTSTTSTYPLGFSGRQNTNNWCGISGATLLTAWQDTNKGGEIAFLTNGSGQVFCAVDGYFYQGCDFRGSHRVVDTYDLGSYYTKTESNNLYVKTDGTGATGTWGINITGNADTAEVLKIKSINTETSITESGIRGYSGSGSGWTGSIRSMAYAAIFSFGNPSRGWQLWAGRTGEVGNGLCWRRGIQAATSWDSERLILDSGNYTDYTVTKTGTGASGTWGISISGNAATATSASSVAWSSITNKPINFKAYYGSLASGGWKTMQGKDTSPSIAISYNNGAASWNSGTYSATLVYGNGDTRGLLDCAYNAPTVTFGGCAYGNSTDNDPAWYIKLTGTNGTTYNLNSMPYAESAGSVAWANVSDKPSTFAPSSHTHNYLPLAGGTMNQGSHVIFPGTSTDTNYGGSIEFREVNYVTTSQTDWSYAPGITFHWGGIAVGKLGLRSDGNLAWRNQTIIHSGNIGSQSVNYATSSGTANSPRGFSFSDRSSSDWSGVNGTFITDWAHSSGADIMFKNNGGALHVITDGYFYQGIDYRGATYRVLDEYDITHTTWGNADTLDGYHASKFLLDPIWNKSINVAGDGWYRVARYKTSDMVRGITIFYLTISGGSWSPNYAKYTIYGTWSHASAYDLQVESNSYSFGGLRTTYEGDYIYIEVYFKNSISGAKLVVPAENKINEVNVSQSWEWFSGDLSTGGGTTVSATASNISSGHTRNSYITSSGFIKISSSNDYLLLGGGGHKAVSDFSLSGHSHSEFMYRNGYMGDFNANNAAGVYFINPSATNKPDGNDWSNYGICLVAKSPGDTCAQMVWDYSSGRFEVRVGNNSGANWQSWRQVMYTDMTLTNTEIDAIMV